MVRGKLGLLAGSTVLACLLAAGCCQEQDKKIQILLSEKQQAMDQNNDLRSQLSAANTREAQLVRNLEDRDAAMANLTAEAEGYRRIMNDPNFGLRPKGAEGWESGPFGDKITVGGDLLFAPGQAALTAAGMGKLDQIVRDIKTSYPGLVVRVYGYTDTDPIRKSPWKDNLELSGNRAMAVTRYLVSKGIGAKLVETVAMGEHHPVAGSKDKSRRVEIFVVRSK